MVHLPYFYLLAVTLHCMEWVITFLKSAMNLYITSQIFEWWTSRNGYGRSDCMDTVNMCMYLHWCVLYACSRGMRFENVNILTELIMDIIKDMRYCWWVSVDERQQRWWWWWWWWWWCTSFVDCDCWWSILLMLMLMMMMIVTMMTMMTGRQYWWWQ